MRIAGAPVGTIVGESGPPASRRRSPWRSTARPSSPSTPTRRARSGSQSVIGEKFVDCNPGLRPPEADANTWRGPGAGTLLPAGDQHQLASRLRHRPGHLARARQRAVRPDPQRAGHWAGRSGGGPERGHPPGGPGPGLHRSCAADPGSGEPRAGRAGHGFRHRPRPLAQFKRQLAGFVVHANTTAVASAARATDIQRSFHLLPTFLARSAPADGRSGVAGRSGNARVQLAQPGGVGINSQYAESGWPFASATRTSLINLGRSAVEPSNPHCWPRFRWTDAWSDWAAPRSPAPPCSTTLLSSLKGDRWHPGSDGPAAQRGWRHERV